MVNESHGNHIDEEILERYALVGLAEDEAAPVEEHLLVCHSCQDRLVETDEYIRTVRAAVPKPKPFEPDCCQVQWKLMQAWNTAVREFSFAANAFSNAIRNSPRAECDKLRAEVEHARLASDDARLSWDFHRKEHGCDNDLLLHKSRHLIKTQQRWMERTRFPAEPSERDMRLASSAST